MGCLVGNVRIRPFVSRARAGWEFVVQEVGRGHRDGSAQLEVAEECTRALGGSQSSLIVKQVYSWILCTVLYERKVTCTPAQSRSYTRNMNRPAWRSWVILYDVVVVGGA